MVVCYSLSGVYSFTSLVSPSPSPSPARDFLDSWIDLLLFCDICESTRLLAFAVEHMIRSTQNIMLSLWIQHIHYYKYTDICFSMSNPAKSTPSFFKPPFYKRHHTTSRKNVRPESLPLRLGSSSLVSVPPELACKLLASTAVSCELLLDEPV
mmetsp:Transcript_23413/g.27092  ORF Transcript_23413/g.27092 Transcript_23413/m.27092 type:complete len:153 (+) Transcript_23413:108-566(+)